MVLMVTSSEIVFYLSVNQFLMSPRHHEEKKSPATTEKEKKSKWTILFYDASQQNTLKNIWSFCV